MILEIWKFWSWREFLGKYMWWGVVKVLLQLLCPPYYKTVSVSVWHWCLTPGDWALMLLNNLILWELVAYKLIAYIGSCSASWNYTLLICNGQPNSVCLGQGVAFLENQMDKDRGTVNCSLRKKKRKIFICYFCL